MVGLSLASFGVSMAIVQGGIIRWVIPRFGDRNTVIYGFLFNFFAFTVLMLIENGLMALLFTPVTALGAVVTPAVQGMMSRIAGDDQQGELQGVIASSKAMAAILSPLVMTQVFWWFTGGGGLYLPGAPFGVAAALMLVCFAVFVLRPRRVVA